MIFFIVLINFKRSQYCKISGLCQDINVENKALNYKKEGILFIVFFLLFSLSRFIPFIKNVAPLGYDTGLYRGFIYNFTQNLPHFDIASIAKNEPPLLYVLADVLHYCNLSIDFFLGYFYYLASIIFALLLFYFLRKKYSNSAGLAGLFLLTISLAQFEAYWQLFYKNILAFIITLLIFYFLEKKNYWLCLILGGALGGLHHMSFVPLAGAIFLAGIFIKEKRKNYLFLFFGICFLALACYAKNFNVITHYLPFTQEKLQNMANLDSSDKTGMFWGIADYLFYALWYLPLLFYALYKKIKARKLDYLFWYFIIVFLIVASQLFFYKRFLIHLDFIAIILIAPILADLFKYIFRKNNILIYTLFFLWALFLIVRIFIFSFTTDSFISEQEFQAVKELKNLPPSATIISTNNIIAPWIYGYSEHNNIWPGKFKNDPWKYGEWQTFWHTDVAPERYELLNEVAKPVYIFVPQNNPLKAVLENDAAFIKHSDYLFEYLGN